MEAGVFIVLEGADGVGKSTQVALLSEWLGEQGVDHLVTREPGGTPVGEAVRSVVLGRRDLEMPPETELFLILAARAAFVADVVRPALDAGRTVIADRFALSTLAYQGHARGLDLDRVREAIGFATGGLEPDLCLVLDLPEAEAESRLAATGEGPDRIEQEGSSFRRAVRDGYLALADSESGVEVIDAGGTPEEVHERIRERLRALLPAG